MRQAVLAGLVENVIDSAQDIRLFWQIGVVLLAVGLAWLLARVLRQYCAPREPESAVARLGMQGVARVLEPLLAVLLIAVGRAWLARWQPVPLLTLVLPILASFALIRLGFYVVRSTFSRTRPVRGWVVLVERSFATLVWLALVLHFTGLGPELWEVLDDIVLPVGPHHLTLAIMLQALALVVLSLMLALWASATLEARLMQWPEMHSSLKVVLSRIGRAMLVFAAMLFALSAVGIDLTVLSVFGGALGVGLGFGLQKVASSYVSGFIILFERSMSIGDLIHVDRFQGSITQINTRYTVLKGTDGGESIIPNELLVSSPVQNYSLSDRALVLTTDLTVAYGTDIETLLPALCAVVAAVPRVASYPAPSAFLLKFGADGLELRVAFWINDPEQGRTNVLSDVNRALWKKLAASGVELPYAHRVVTLRRAPAPDGTGKG